MKEYLVRDWNDYIDIICDISYGLGKCMWYRGQEVSNWDLLPAVKRQPYCKPGNEQYLATDFYIETKRRRKDVPQNQSGWLSLMQHYGLPTRLLDWSSSPLVALYFATCNRKMHTQEDAAVWILDPEMLNEVQGYKKYIFPMDYTSIEELVEGAFKPVQETNKILACCNVECDLRMYVQQANFTIHDSNIPLNLMDSEDLFLSKMIIPSKMKEGLALQLNVLGFSERTIFPDIEHIAHELREIFSY